MITHHAIASSSKEGAIRLFLQINRLAALEDILCALVGRIGTSYERAG